MSEATVQRAPVGARTWVLWALLSAAGLVAVWLIMLQYPGFGMWPVVPFPHIQWMLPLRFYVAPALGLGALILPVLTLGALIFGRFHATALIALTACVMLLFGYLGIEAFWAAQPEPAWPS